MEKQQKNSSSSFFNDGDRPTLMEVLNRKEERVFEIQNLLRENSNKVVLCFKLNIPGEIKNNEVIYKVFEKGVSEIKAKIEIEYDEIKNLKTGPEYLALVSGNSLDIKKTTVDIEEQSTLGRLYDIDVDDINGQVSRADLNVGERKCFICDKPSKVCASQRAHTVLEMLLEIEKIIAKSGITN